MGVPGRLFVFPAPVSTILRLVELLSIDRRVSLALNRSLPHSLKITEYDFFCMVFVLAHKLFLQ